MTPFAATVRYRFGEGDGSRDASFYGLFFERSDDAVRRRLEEAHRFASWVEVVEVRWRGGDGAAWEGRRDERQYFVSPRDRRERTPVRARGGRAWSSDMEAETITRDGTAGEARGPGRWQPRRHARCRMFKPAHVVTADAVLDCVLLDLSPGGAQVCLTADAELPDRVVLWLPIGESRPVRRVWQQGALVGFEAVGDAAPAS